MVKRHIVYVYTHIIQEEEEEDLCRIMKDRDGCADRQGRMNIIRTHTIFSEQIVQNTLIDPSLCSINNWYKCSVVLVSSSVGALAQTRTQDEVSGELSLTLHSEIAFK